MPITTGFAAYLVLALHAAPAEPVLLRRTFTPNTVDHYKIETKVFQHMVLPGGMGEQDVDMTTTMDFAMKYGAVAQDGSAELEVEASRITHESTAPIPDAAKNDFKARGRIDGRYLVTDLKAVDGTAETNRLVQGLGSTMQHIHLPEKAVEVGESWEWHTPPMPALAYQSLQITVRFEGERTVDGRTYHVLVIDDVIPLDVDLKKAMEATGQEARGEMKMKGTAVMKLESLLEKGSGRIFSTMGTTRMEMKVLMEEMGLEIDTNVDIDSKMQFVEPEATTGAKS